MTERSEIVREFVEESVENLDRVDRHLILLESDPRRKDDLDDIFRTLHTLKGTSAFLALPQLERVAHAGEHLLGRLRDGDIVCDLPTTKLLFAVVDAIRRVLVEIAQHETEGSFDPSDLVARLMAASEAPATPVVEQVVEQAAEHATVPPIDATAPAGEGTIRVGVAMLDNLLNLVGELVLARDEVATFASAQADPRFRTTSQKLGTLTSAIHDVVMTARMVPVGTVLGKLPRIVRDVALECGKTVSLELDGEDTELDKTLAEALRDPLIHLLRNAVDHGIEPAAERRARGKPEAGSLFVRAYHEGGTVHIEVADDGGGVDVDAVRARAIERGLVSPADGSRLTEADAARLVFAPGLSTRDAVTHVSGRGVGMDVVKTNIEKIGGTVDIESERHRGTTIHVRLPLTLAVVPALLVSCRGQHFSLPQVSVAEVLHVEASQIESVHGAPVFRLRGMLVPIVYLDVELALVASAAETRGNALVVLRIGHAHVGLILDAAEEIAELVVKPLHPALQAIGIYAGASVLGDGSIALVLDPRGLLRRARAITEADASASRAATALAASTVRGEPLLVVAGADDERMAVPLGDVVRVGEVASEAIERVGDEEVIQYMGAILPVVRLSSALVDRRRERRAGAAGAPPSTGARMQPLAVIAAPSGEHVVLLVDRIIDIVEADLGTRRPASRGGVLFSALVGGRVTELLDLAALSRPALAWRASQAPAPERA
jgi:two-component system chemotaxis sensor kinase CheA